MIITSTLIYFFLENEKNNVFELHIVSGLVVVDVVVVVVVVVAVAVLQF